MCVCVCGGGKCGLEGMAAELVMGYQEISRNEVTANETSVDQL